MNARQIQNFISRHEATRERTCELTKDEWSIHTRIRGLRKASITEYGNFTHTELKMAVG